MTAKFEKTSTNKGTLTFEIPKDSIEKALDSVFKRVRKDVQVPGFRKGHVPRQVFNNTYGEEALYEEALNMTLPDAYEGAVKEAGLEVVVQPEINVESMGKGQPWVLTAEVVLKPEVKLGDYKGLEVEKESTEVTEEEVDAAIEELRQQFGELALKDAPAEEGDTVVMDFEGLLDGEAFEGGTAQNHSLELGSGSFIPGFEEQLIGKEPGEELDVNVTFPEEYHEDALAGQDAVFKVKIHEVKTKELPELDDDFAMDADDEVDTLDELKAKIRKQLETSKHEEAKEAFEDQALRQAVENAEIVDLPEEMIEEEINRQMEQFLNNLQRQGLNEELYYQLTQTTREDLHGQFEDEAELRTKTNLVLEAIAKAENTEVTDADVEEEVATLAEQYAMDEDQVRHLVTNDMLKSDIELKKSMNTIIDSAVEK